MGAKDYASITLAVIALLVSLFSLAVANRADKFNRRVKTVELRENLLARQIRALQIVEKVVELTKEIQTHAEQRNDLKAYRASEHDTVKGLHKKLIAIRETIENRSLSKIVDTYDGIASQLYELEFVATKVLNAAEEERSKL